MDNWIRVPNKNYNAIPQGVRMSDNPKDYIYLIEQEEREAANDPGIIITNKPRQERVKVNDISEILK